MAEAFKICPACEARNRVSWEFCVKCGEALHEVEAEVPEPDSFALGPVEVSPAAAFWGLGGILAVVLVGGWVTGRLWPVEAPQGPDPSNFPSLAAPSPLPPGSPTEPPPGAESRREGHQLLLDGDGEAALDALRKAVAEAPEDAQIRNLYAHALWKTGETELALSEFRNAMQLGNTRSLQLKADFATALAGAGRPADAIRELETLVAADPRSAGTYRQLGQLYLEEGRGREAAAALERATELAPRNADLQEQLGFVLEQSGQTSEAVAAYRRAAELAPGDGGKAIRLAEVVSQEDPEQGIALLREAAGRIPSQPILQQRLGIALERAGKKGEAVAAYREYLRQAPNASDAERVAARAAHLEEGSEGR